MPNPRIASPAGTINERMLELDRSVVGAVLARLGAALSRLASAVWGAVCRHPWDALGLVAVAGAAVAILANALLLQVRPHPAPMLSGTLRAIVPNEPAGGPARTSKSGSTAEAPARTRAQIVFDIQRELSRRGFFDGPVDGVYGAKTDAAIRDFEQAAGLRTGAQPDEVLLRAITRSSAQQPATLPAAAQPATTSALAPRPAEKSRTALAAKPSSPSKRILAVQRALADFGYGQVKPTGVMGAETRMAIERFERERKLPVTGQISDRLTRELAAVTGRPLD